MRKWKVFCILFLLLSFLLISCATRTEYETVEVKVPVPVTVDITDIVNPVLQQRPDNGSVQVYAGPVFETYQVVANMGAYFDLWQKWEAYADSLEKTIGIIGEKLSVGE